MAPFESTTPIKKKRSTNAQLAARRERQRNENAARESCRTLLVLKSAFGKLILLATGKGLDPDMQIVSFVRVPLPRSRRKISCIFTSGPATREFIESAIASVRNDPAVTIFGPGRNEMERWYTFCEVNKTKKSRRQLAELDPDSECEYKRWLREERERAKSESFQRKQFSELLERGAASSVPAFFKTEPPFFV